MDISSALHPNTTWQADFSEHFLQVKFNPNSLRRKISSPQVREGGLMAVRNDLKKLTI
jgi:hypothetical protein